MGPDEPHPVEVLNPASQCPVLLVCEHAGDRVPLQLAAGYSRDVMGTHYGADLGAGAVTRLLAERLGATAVLARYSRIVIDPNRRLDDPTLVLAEADGAPVSANQNLSASALKARITDLYLPLHLQIAAELSRLASRAVPIYVAIHSFTPMLAGSARPWDAGIMWDTDARVADRVIASLAAASDFQVGLNEPYTGKAPQDFSVDFHAERNGLPNVAIEMRQDHLATQSGIERWAVLLETALRPLLGADWAALPAPACLAARAPDQKQFEADLADWMRTT
ncbi:MAG: N-formylglutamate amidohydrolase [Pseudomonadota bacterium]